MHNKCTTSINCFKIMYQKLHWQFLVPRSLWLISQPFDELIRSNYKSCFHQFLKQPTQLIIEPHNCHIGCTKLVKTRFVVWSDELIIGLHAKKITKILWNCWGINIFTSKWIAYVSTLTETTLLHISCFIPIEPK